MYNLQQVLSRNYAKLFAADQKWFVGVDQKPISV